MAAPPSDVTVFGAQIFAPGGTRRIDFSKKDPNYKRVVIACFIQAAYLLEIDRQEKRTGDGALAPKWWKPFKYKLAQALVDERDGSIYGALFEWDLAAAISELIVARPGGAPRAVLALRGTLLTSPTIRRDLEDDLRFLGWESLRGSTRYGGALAALKSAVEKHGDGNVWVGGHSLGAGFALQVGKALAKQGAFVECHLFNPPSISLTAAVRNIGDTAAMVWRRITSAPPVSGDAPSPSAELSRSWVPHLYVNQSDYICCLYTKFSRSNGDLGDDLGRTIIAEDPGGSAATRLFVASKGPKRFLEAHGLQQWWSDDIELQQALDHSRLINRQLRSLYTLPQPPPQPTPQTPGSI
ncbi:unnamed protein product [Spirodela intermedia]|uniref:Fungal lipase-type domain-containing protein n=1 Tax=Spirodela intermedia TaxID=51605 RepID=A0A7I8LGD1_SPIIN|nr:unnamed protein product [Spirodela intermedia]